jgi:ribonuclease G
MTVIDVNTGRYIGKADLEETILQTNLEAAEEIVRQLRLRNIGGLIVIDFIDMAHPSNRQRLFKYFDKTLKERDKFQSVVLRLSEFGLVQMTRKRVGKTLLQELGVTCPTCHGLGSIKSIRTLCYELLPRIKQELQTMKKSGSILLYFNPQIFEFLTEYECNSILELEKKYHCKFTIVSDESLAIDQYRIDG